MPNSSSLSLFIPLTKVDEEKREVWGTLTQEVPDRGGEIFDYDSSKPHFQKWSDDAAKVTDGKSLGNVREMHQPSAVGKLIAMQCDDDTKAINIGAKVVDDDAWNKVLEGVYTGFSAGGKYVRKWTDPANPKLRRFEAVPYEASLVDLPAVPTATYQLVKAGGLVETHQFKKIAEREDTSPKAGKEKYGDVKFADPKNKKYPLDTKAHVRAALSYWGMPKNRAKYSAKDQATIGARIRAAAKKFGIDASEKAVLAGDFSKGLWDVGQLAGLVQSLVYVQESAALERELEGDDSAVPDDLCEAVTGLLDTLEDMLAEESGELIARLEGQNKNSESSKAAGSEPASAPTPRTPTMPNTTGEQFRKIAKRHLEKLADLHEHAKAVHKLFGDHVDKLTGSEHHEMAKAVHTMMGDHVEKLAGFAAEVGGLPTTESDGSEKSGVGDDEGAKAAKVEMAKIAGDLETMTKRATDAEAANASLQKQLNEALELGEKLMEQRKGALLSVDRSNDGNATAKAAKPTDDSHAPAEIDPAKQTDAEMKKNVRGALRTAFGRPRVSNGFEEVQIGAEK